MKKKKVMCPYCFTDIYADLKHGNNTVLCKPKVSYLGCGREFTVKYKNGNIYVKSLKEMK